MEEWEINFEWLRIRNQIKDAFKKPELPDLNAVLLLVGIQILGRWQKTYTKEEKQDLMHIATCKVLSFSGFYELEGLDEAGWPHWNLVTPVPSLNLKEQDILLKAHIIHYFESEVF